MTGGLLGKSADWYAAAGWKVFPCHGIVRGKCTCGKVHSYPKDFGKHPRTRDGQKSATDDRHTVARWWEDMPDSNVAVQCSGSGFLVVDIDPRNGGLESWDRLDELTGGTMEDTVEARTGLYTTPGGSARGRHLFYRVGEGEALKDKVEGVPGIDIKHKGYVLIAPSQHGSGLTYEWAPGKAPWEKQMAWAPDELLGLLRRKAPGAGGEAGGGFGIMEWDGTKLDVDKLIKDGIYAGARSNTLHKIACSIANEIQPARLRTELGKQQVRFSMQSINNMACRPPMTWGDGGSDDFAPQCESAIDFVIEHPKDRGTAEVLKSGVMTWVDTTSTRVVEPRRAEGEKRTMAPVGLTEMPVNPGDLPDDPDELNDDRLDNEVDESGNPVVVRRTLTDRGNARRLRDWYRGTVRYTPGLGWFIWNEEYWYPDVEGLGVLEKSQAVAQLIAREAAGLEAGSQEIKAVLEWALASKGTGKLKSCIEQWRADSRYTRVGVEAWDSNPYYLGVKNGVIDLRTGDLLRGTLEMGITKQSPVAYTPGQRNVKWEEFLRFATGGDTEFQEWLQRAAGYTLTGLRTYDVLFMVYGQPGSGKSTFLEALMHVLGKDYATTMNSNVLVDDGMKSSSDEYHWAKLMGMRMVTFSEWPHGKRTKEDAVKRLTGDVTIQARHPGERPFNFESEAKLWIGTNSRPRIQEEAMWRRIRAIPFSHIPEVPDNGLKDYLMDAEGGLPAVVAWAVEGAVKLVNSPHRDGLGWCSVVADASAEYRRQEDRIGMFLDEETVVGEGTSVPIKVLHAVFNGWCEDRGESKWAAMNFRKVLEERGIVVSGLGQRAIIEDRSLLPRVVGSDTDWGTLSHHAR